MGRERRSRWASRWSFSSKGAGSTRGTSGGMAAQCCHCRHTEDDTPVLPAKLPVVPVKPTKPELAILFGHLNRSKNSIKFQGGSQLIKEAPHDFSLNF